MDKVIFLIGGIDLVSAPFNRFITIVKAVQKTGYSVDVVMIRPMNRETDWERLLIRNNSFVYDGITFRNCFTLSREKDSIVRKLIMRIKTYYSSYRILCHSHIISGTFLYIYSVSLFDHIFFYLLKKAYRLRYINERNEYPQLIRQPEKYKTFIYKALILPWCFRLFDGMVIMTGSLIRFYKSYTKKSCKILKIPMTVDFRRFECQAERNEKYIGYAGSLNCRKDGLDILIRAFHLIHSEFPEYYLRIVGDTENTKEKEFLRNLCSDLQIKDRVIFMGEKNRNEIPEFICMASLLVLPRPESKQAEGGFPTKLGEYLASGNPVVVSDVGEISEYLRDGQDAYFVEPGNTQDLANKIRLALSNYSEAERIGIEGKRTARHYFDYFSHVNHIEEFFDSFK
ncbi:MAG TPA: glycosyltransferase [Bacteroidetes bacterium]|nr:glycosyltransferase [Bacteroidota bacterium]